MDRAEHVVREFRGHDVRQMAGAAWIPEVKPAVRLWSVFRCYGDRGLDRAIRPFRDLDVYILNRAFPVDLDFQDFSGLHSNRSRFDRPHPLARFPVQTEKDIAGL